MDIDRPKGRKVAPRRRVGIWIGLGLFVVLIIGISFAASASQPQGAKEHNVVTQRQPKDHDMTQTRDIRIADKAALDLGAPEVAVVRLLEGTIPDGATSGTVLTDTDCGKDEQGVSHCKNMIDFGNGQTVIVVHDHVLEEVPCFAPPAQVNLV